MEQIPSWAWALFALAASAGAAWLWLGRSSLLAGMTELKQQLQAQRDRSESLLREAARLPDLLKRMADTESKLQQLDQELKICSAREAGASASLASARAAQEQLGKERESLLGQLDTAARENSAISSRLAKAIAERDSAIEAHAQTRTFLDDAQSKLKTAFIEAASKVFDDKATALDKQITESATTSQTGLERTLKPFADKLGEFQLELRKLGGDQATNLSTLVGSINQLQSLNQTMATSADNLTRALKGNAKTRGDWGEMILDTVLKSSGLEEGSNYRKQDTGRDEDTGKLLRPDVIVDLPDGRQVVVDSKVNLVAWADANNAESPAEYQEALLRHTAALRTHVRDLADKNYPGSLGTSALDLTVMFIPIEGALAAALAVNPELQAEAFKRKVVFASPNTLMAMLRVVERLWTRDKLQRQVGIIGSEAGKLLDALSSFVEEFNEIETRIAAAGKAFGAAKRRLSDSEQSVYARARRLVEAGAKGRKSLPQELAPVAEVAPSLGVDPAGIDSSQPEG